MRVRGIRLLVFLVMAMFFSSLCWAEDGGSILFILDASGSMNQRIEGKSKLNIAKEVLAPLVEDLPSEAKVGLLVYGYKGKQKGCKNIELIAPLKIGNQSVIKSELTSMVAQGKTPIAASLEKGAEVMKSLPGKKTMILISDGEETCGGKPIKAARRIREELGMDVVIHVIGFNVKGKGKEQLAGIAQAGGGNYYSADNARQLKDSLAEIKQEVVKEEPKEEPRKEPELPKDIFVEEFDQPFLSEEWNVMNDNSDSRTLEDGIFYIISTPGSFSKESVQNMLLYNKPIEKKDYEVVTKFNVPLTSYGNSDDGQQWIGLIFYADKDNMIGLVVYGFYGYFTGGSGNAGLVQSFKIQGGKWTTSDNSILFRGQNSEPSTYYLKIEKRKFKYTAYYSIDGRKWNKVGTMAMLGKKLKPGIFALRGNNAQEIIAEFDSFKIKGVE